MNVSSLLKNKGSQVWSVAPDDSVFDALKVLAEHNIGVVPVVDSDKLVGIFSERDYARRIVLYGRNSKDTTVSEVMTQNVETATPEDSIEDCMKLVVNRGFRHLPIVDNETLVGIISGTDLLAEIIRHREREINKLESFITGTGEIT